jgi:hypothetical protein
MTFSFIAELKQNNCTVDLYYFQDWEETASIHKKALKQTKKAHLEKILQAPEELRVSVCVAQVQNRLFLATRGLITSRCTPHSLVGDLRRQGIAENLWYIELLESIMRNY